MNQKKNNSRRKKPRSEWIWLFSHHSIPTQRRVHPKASELDLDLKHLKNQIVQASELDLDSDLKRLGLEHLM